MSKSETIRDTKEGITCVTCFNSVKVSTKILCSLSDYDDHAFYSFQNKIIPFSNAVERSLQRYHISAEDVVYDTTLSSSINIAGRFTYRRVTTSSLVGLASANDLVCFVTLRAFWATLSLTCYKELGHKINK